MMFVTILPQRKNKTMTTIIHKGCEYFPTYIQAREVAKAIEGDQVLFFGETIAAQPRIVTYELGYAVQYCKSGSYYPEQHKTTWSIES